MREMTPIEIFNVAKEALLAIAAMVTAGAAVSGLRTWKRELKGKAEFEAARGLARATYKLRDELGYARAPFIRGNEFPAEDFESAKAYEHLFTNRWRPVIEAINSFEAAALEAESLWGASIRPNTDKMMTCVRTLRVATEAVLEDKLTKGENFKADRDFGKRMRQDVFGSASSADNPLSVALTAAVADIEETLKPHLARK
jgi:hypothetical protein